MALLSCLASTHPGHHYLLEHHFESTPQRCGIADISVTDAHMSS